MSTTTWGKLTDEQRQEAIRAVLRGEDKDEVAARYGLKASSFRRQLRRLNSDGEPVSLKTEGGDSISHQFQLNTAYVTSKSPRITTLEQLLEVCNVDLDVWRVDRYLVNKWEVGAKAEKKDLEWTAGVLDGTLQSEGLTVSPLFQVKAWLVRREPEALFPTIQPVASAWNTAEFAQPWAVGKDREEDNGIRRSLVFSDTQFGFARDVRSGLLTPFHDRRALDIILQIAEASQPDRVDFLGDLLDLAEWADRFIRSPEFVQCTQPAILEGYYWFAKLRATVGPDVRVTAHQGNHDARMDTAMVTHLRAAYDLRAAAEMHLPPAISVPKLLSFSDLGINWIDGYPDDWDWLNDVICLSHGDLARVPGQTAKAVSDRTDVTEIIGHIHRREWMSRTRHLRDGTEVIDVFCPGCVCHVDGRVPGKGGKQQWQQGIAIVDYQEDGRDFSITPVRIDNGRAVWNGQLFQARDHLDDIRSAWPDWNWGENGE